MADISVKAKIVQKDQVLAIDIILIDKIAILIGLATPLGLTLAYSLNNLVLKKSIRSVEHVRKGIAHFLGVLGSQGFKTSVIMSDGEGAVITLVDELGVDVDISGAGSHTSLESNEGFELSKKGYVHMYTFCLTHYRVWVSLCVYCT